MSAVTPEDLAARSAATMLGSDRASNGLGMVLEQVGPGHATVVMTVREDMTNGHALCHGGLIATLADTAFAVACNSYGEVSVASGFEITFLEPGRAGDVLVARAVERRRRGRTGLYDVTVTRRAGEGAEGAEEAVIAEFRGHSRSLGRPIG